MAAGSQCRAASCSAAPARSTAWCLCAARRRTLIPGRRWHIDGFVYGKSACLERPSIGLVSILHIDIQEGFPWFAYTAAITDQDQRVANPHFSRGASSHFAAGAEDQFEEADDATNVLREHPRDNGWPAIWSEIGHQPSLAAGQAVLAPCAQKLSNSMSRASLPFPTPSGRSLL